MSKPVDDSLQSLSILCIFYVVLFNVELPEIDSVKGLQKIKSCLISHGLIVFLREHVGLNIGPEEPKASPDSPALKTCPESHLALPQLAGEGRLLEPPLYLDYPCLDLRH